MKRASGAIVWVVVLASATAEAHEVRPGYLQLRQIDGPTYDLLWKVPARGNQRLGMYLYLPESCRPSESGTSFIDGAYIERAHLHCDGGLVGKQIRIDGLDDTRTDVLARIERMDGSTQTARLTPDVTAFTVVGAPTGWAVATSYFGLGIEHILFGVDHLLFVFALLFVVGSWARLVATVSAFTVAHSLTLAAATLGWVHVPQKPVEAAIALSIVFVATDILRTRSESESVSRRAPWFVAFVFGLLHGLGFAGALAAVGIPENAVPTALLFFNLGVEAGQLVFIAAVFSLLWFVKIGRAYATREADMWSWGLVSLASKPAAYAIGTVAAFWVVQRTVDFWV